MMVGSCRGGRLHGMITKGWVWGVYCRFFVCLLVFLACVFCLRLLLTSIPSGFAYVLIYLYSFYLVMLSCGHR